MQIQINADEVFEEYKRQLAELHHELLLEKIKTRKLVEQIEQHENAEYLRVQEAAKKREEAAQRALALPAPPELPDAPQGAPVAGEG